MSVSTSLAVVAVSDLAAAQEFYARLFDRAADLAPMAGLAQWDFDPGGGVQVIQDAVRSGSSLLTLLVTDLDELLATLAGGGVPTGDVTEGVISRVAQVCDPAGNLVTLAELYA